MKWPHRITMPPAVLSFSPMYELAPGCGLRARRRAAHALLAGLVLVIAGCAGRQEPNSGAPANAEPFAFDARILDAGAAPFIPHTGAGLYQRYLAVNLSYPLVARLRRDVEQRFAVSLTDRGESHITVITPPEYEAFAHLVPIDRLTGIFATTIQDTTFEPQCVGRGVATLEGREQQTWFVVIRSPDLRRVRDEVQDLIVAAGGPATIFDPANWNPHITLGYTQRDLYIDDGVVKNTATCVAAVRLLQ